MILLLDTSTPLCKITFIDDGWRRDEEWQADRTLARDLLGYLNKMLCKYGRTWLDITAIGVFEGPGSFTGLRIGLTVMNTIADAQGIPIVGGRSNSWQDEVIAKLKSDKNEKIVLPFYGSDAHITKPKK